MTLAPTSTAPAVRTSPTKNTPPRSLAPVMKKDNKQWLLGTPSRITVNNKGLISKRKLEVREKNMQYKSHGIIKNYNF